MNAESAEEGGKGGPRRGGARTPGHQIEAAGPQSPDDGLPPPAACGAAPGNIVKTGPGRRFPGEIGGGFNRGFPEDLPGVNK